VPDKSKLAHEAFDQTHDDWYFKMYFDLLKVILERKSSYRIFLDIGASGYLVASGARSRPPQ
jgi:hypothetical protein